MSIVVAYTPGAVGAAVVDFAIAEARRRATSVVVVNSTRADRLVDPRYSQGDDWEELVARLDESGVEHSQRHLTSSDTAAADILGAAEEASAELIVVGVRKRTPVGKLIMGSTAQSVILHAACPVVAVKPA